MSEIKLLLNWQSLGLSLRGDDVVSALIGASCIEQIVENVRTLDNITFYQEDTRFDR